jgi:hypothetical protein
MCNNTRTGNKQTSNTAKYRGGCKPKKSVKQKQKTKRISKGGCAAATSSKKEI